jgi:hypothetical protein
MKEPAMTKGTSQYNLETLVQNSKSNNNSLRLITESTREERRRKARQSGRVKTKSNFEILNTLNNNI